MLDKLEAAVKRFRELEKEIADPEVLADHNRWRELVREHARLGPLVDAYSDYRRVCRELEEARELLQEKLDPEFRKLVESELDQLAERKEQLVRQLRELLLPPDPRDERNVILEIRAGTGGEEAALFAADLLRMYVRYAERKGWQTEILSSSPTDIGGFKEVILMVKGRRAYSHLKFESGVHRVQRVPRTESQGRIHTSTATVAVLPEAEEVEVEIKPEDLSIDTFCASGPGGQSVNTTYSAVRITHLPTGLVVTCQDERSQHKNKERALKVLRARLLAKLQEQRDRELAAQRRAQVGTAERSEKVRTYNFPQNRVTDHRIGLTLYRLESVLDGDIDEIVQALVEHDQVNRLGSVS